MIATNLRAPSPIPDFRFASITHLALLAVIAAALPHAVYAQRGNQTERQQPPAVQACVGCHGTQGQGNPDAEAPRLAGQSAYYLLKQLDSYANGSRRNRVMEPIAKGLAPEVRADVARYYAAIDAPFDKRIQTQRSPERGRVLAMEGDNARKVQACRNCHGPGGVGEPPNIPYLAGLDAKYLSAALNAWQEGTRTNDAGLQMFTIARALSRDDIDAVAKYYATLPPPKPAPVGIVQAPPAQKKPAGATPSIEAAKSAGGNAVGIEQSAPMRGGTEGAGGGDVSKDPAANGANSRDGNNSSESPAKTKNENESKNRTKTSGIVWPRLSDASKADLSTASDQLVAAGDPARGRAIIAAGVHGCAACHSIPGIRSPNGIVGPPLRGFSERGFIAGQLPNRPDVLVAFLRNPPALVPQTGMPNVGLTMEQARDIAAYLYTLNTARNR